MDNEQKNRLKYLKQKNYERLKKDRLKKDLLLQECIEVLGDSCYIIEYEKGIMIYNKFIQMIPFLPWGIDWDKFDVFREINFLDELEESCINRYFYIIWGKDLPIIKSDIKTIAKYIYDIIAVSPDTWMLAENYGEIIEFYHEGKVIVGQIKQEWKNVEEN